jgi:DNA replication protein DnaC
LASLAGDPNCPYCGGLGYIRQDLPVGHPEFGRLQVCTCRDQAVRQDIHNRLFSMSNLDELRHLTFDSFKQQGRIGLPLKQADSLKGAYNTASHFAKNLNGWLILFGGYGCGKTHLAAAIANFAVDLGTPTLFITVPDMLDTLRFAYSSMETSFEERFEEIRRSPLLILDDFGTQNATPWAQEKLFQIINYRYINNLPTVVTTNLDLSSIEGRIRSRFIDEKSTRVHITAPDYRNAIDDTDGSSLSSLSLLRNCTFATLDDRRAENIDKEALQKFSTAIDLCREFAEKPDGWLLIMGGYGSGKTHLAAAIANYRAEQGYPVVFVVVPDLLDYLRAAFNPDSAITLDRRFEEVRTAALLVLDDLGTQSMTPWAREKIYQLFNYRYNARLPTVITSVLVLEEMEDRLRSRLMDRRLCKNISLLVPSYTGQDKDKTEKTPARRGRK